MLKAIERIDVAVARLEPALATYERNFGLRAAGQRHDGEPMLLPIGESAIGLIAAETGARQGMVALWLLADDVEQVRAALTRAGFGCRPMRRQGAMRVVEVERGCGQGPLFIFDRRP
ncbi:MAG TPA: VOC family protein [Candidatus Binataceae bacterium]|nr:VOC family protein [Candidatus Binataceae bacterium]